MLTQQTDLAKGDLPKKSPLILVLAIVAVVIVGAGIGYMQLTKSALNDEQKRLKDETQSLQTEINTLESQKIEAAQLAQQWLATISKNEIRWSNVLDKINSLVPEDALGQKKLNFLSYSGSEGGKLTLNGQTIPAKDEPYGDLSDLVAAFNSSSFFNNAYIPTISRGETDTGDKLLSFVFNLNYKEKTPDEISSQAASLSAPVPVSTPAPAPVSVVTGTSAETVSATQQTQNTAQ